MINNYNSLDDALRKTMEIIKPCALKWYVEDNLSISEIEGRLFSSDFNPYELAEIIAYIQSNSKK